MDFRKMNGKLLVEISIRSQMPLQPIRYEYIETEFPSKDEFLSMYAVTKIKFVERNWEIITSRFSGKTLKECGEKFCLSGQRIQGIEDRFMRMMGRKIEIERLQNS